ncbi:MAG: hypothetical protein HOJ34_11950 [Kordiimonadaceae bacterium]|jgi:hypothetical protein|nr:hypothetical protein [Kordiimonadaceae bacterium]MBT6036386.1 hypothetical protein [Kordiimonadaceae bacterium]MBT6330483.1 hypothetical protein [Kordiimonadaceae bacterium]MBT7581489.1 hypothetical protein [Kordiimonadaceae bacterium]
MDIIINIIGLCFIPLLGMLVFSGIYEIYHGLKEYYKFDGIKISEMAFNQSALQLTKSFGFTKFKSDFCKS